MWEKFRGLFIRRRSPGEVRPPWIEYPFAEPGWEGWLEAYSAGWLRGVFLSFWYGLSPEERTDYLQRWPPSEDWREYLTNLQVRPPWIEYPYSEPWWGGWRQGFSEGWLRHVFLPFWHGLSPEERIAYLERWPPPDEHWREYLLEIWV